MKSREKKGLYILSVFLMLIFHGISFAQDTDVQKSNWLLGVIFKLENIKDKAAQDIRKYEDEIQKWDSEISKSENIVKLARQKGNKEAEKIAHNASLKGQEVRIKYREKKNLAELNKKRIEFALAAVKNELSNALSQPQKVKSVITDYSGRVSVQKENGEMIDFGKVQTAFLEKGDIIMTYGDGGAELQFLDGRGSLTVGVDSKVRMEEDDAGTQVINMIQGKINISVEKAENYQKMAEEKIKAYEEELKTVKDEVKQKIVDMSKYIELMGPKFQNKLEVRARNVAIGVRGTQFLVYEDDKKGTEVVVLEGSVEIKGTKEEKTIIVNAGYKITAAKDSILSDPQELDLSKIERWWEK